MCHSLRAPAAYVRMLLTFTQYVCVAAVRPRSMHLTCHGWSGRWWWRTWGRCALLHAPDNTPNIIASQMCTQMVITSLLATIIIRLHVLAGPCPLRLMMSCSCLPHVSLPVVLHTQHTLRGSPKGTEDHQPLYCVIDTAAAGMMRAAMLPPLR